MNLENLLKQLNRIEPDPEYTRRSKIAILSSAQNDSKKTAWGLVWSGIRFSTGAMVTGLVIVLLFVAFSAIKFSAPTPLAALDPITLKAEAEAIDIQIKLATLGYENPAILIGQTSTLKIAAGIINKINIKTSAPEGPATTTGSVQAKNPDNLTIDEVLGKLSE